MIGNVVQLRQGFYFCFCKSHTYSVCTQMGSSADWYIKKLRPCRNIPMKVSHRTDIYEKKAA